MSLTTPLPCALCGAAPEIDIHDGYHWAMCSDMNCPGRAEWVLPPTWDALQTGISKLHQRKVAAFPKMLEALKLLEVDGFTDHTDEALANCAINGQVWDKRLAQQEISRRAALSLAEEAV